MSLIVVEKLHSKLSKNLSNLALRYVMHMGKPNFFPLFLSFSL